MGELGSNRRYCGRLKNVTSEVKLPLFPKAPGFGGRHLFISVGHALHDVFDVAMSEKCGY